MLFEIKDDICTCAFMQLAYTSLLLKKAYSFCHTILYVFLIKDRLLSSIHVHPKVMAVLEPHYMKCLALAQSA